MKRNIIAIMMAMVALLATQCKKAAEPQANAVEGETMEVTVRVDNNTAKTNITATGVVKWKKGDKLYVVGETQGLLGYVSAVAAGDPAQFEGKITALTQAQKLRFYYVGDKSFTLDGSGNYTFDLSAQDGTLEGIAAHNQLMFGKTSGDVAVGDTNLGTITMNSLMAIAHLNITNNTSNTVTVAGGFATSTFNAKAYDGAELTGTPGTITMTSASAIGDCHIALLPGTQTLTLRADGKIAKLAQNPVAANTFYNSETAIPVEMKTAGGALSGLFSVANGKQVYFSQGNLRYQASTNTWRFADNQVDIIGAGNNNIAVDYSGWIDLFGWGTSGFTYDNHGTQYLPYSYETDHSDAYGPSSGDLSVSAQSDWGANAISNGGGYSWRTLTGGENGEWHYLLFQRKGDDSGNYYAQGIVGGSSGTKGLFILPDDWSWDDDEVASLKTKWKSGATNWTTVYTSSEWATMEAAGAVFLPCAGTRTGTSSVISGKNGYYWSSSSCDANNSYSLDFGSGANVFAGTNGHYRYYGLSVRLVTNY